MNTKAVRLTAWLAVVVLLTATPLAFAAPSVPTTAGPAPFDPYILTVIEAEGQADFYAVLKIQADLSAAESLPTKEAKGRYVFEALTEVATKTQGPVLAALATEGATFQPMWIRNMIKVRGDKSLLLQMAARPEVAEIIYEYEPVLDLDPPPAGSGVETVEWNITRVGAPDVWALGFDGSGAVVGDLDTGVQWDHPALINAYRGNLGGGTYDHNYNWYDGASGSTTPLDYDIHGTHTMGTIVGDDGSGNQIGVAPGARWIACPGIGSPYIGTFECFQWFLAPTDLNGQNPQPALAPHVINNSWSSSGTDYHPIIQTLYAAGIFYAKSAGNTGPNCGTITNPGQWPEVTATANFGQGDNISSSSSRGPITLGHDVIMKPDIAAPGTNVRSSVPGDSYANLSGTSMACPHVTGAVALLISARPDLAGKIDVLQMLLKQTAEPKIDAQCPPFVTHPNDVWGWGILDVEAAVLMAQGLGLGGLEGQVTDSGTSAPIADAAITFEDQATGWPLYETSDAGGNYSHSLPAATYTVSASHYGYLTNSIADVAVSDGVIGTQDIALDPAPVWTVSGAVTEVGTGDPLAATLVFDQTPVTASTDPATGAYSAGVAQGTWWIEVRSPGHAGEDRLLTLDQDLTEDFVLPPVDNYYMKHGDGPCDPAFGWLDATGGTMHCLSDDSSRLVNLPSGRTFTFYGNTYTNLYIGSNGHVTFGSGYSKWTDPIPDPALPNNGIYAFSADLNPASCAQGDIYTDLIDDRYFVVQFDAVEHYPSGNPETFEIILDLDTGGVTIQFQTVSDPSQVVVGVENAAGTEASQYAYDDPALIAAGQAVDFWPAFGTPPPTGDPGDLEGTVTDSGSGDPIAGATVSAQAFTGGEVFTFTTGATGVYSGALCADWYSMTASAPGYRPGVEVQTAVYSGTQTVQDLTLAPTEADLWITKTAPSTAVPGGLVTYTLSFGSDGPDTVPWAEVWDPLLESMEYVTSTSPGFYEASEHSVMWHYFDVPAGFTRTATLVVRLTDTVTVGAVLQNHAAFQAVGDGAPQDPDGANNTADAYTTVEAGLMRVYLPIVMRNLP